MSDAHKKLAATPPIAVQICEAWNRFWFSRSDPTTLGLIRLCCGFLVLYVHLAYTYDLQAFFGRDGWVNLEVLDEFRKIGPVGGVPFGWDEQAPADVHDLKPDELEFAQKWGPLPSQVVSRGHYWWSIWFHVTDPFWMMVAHVAILLAMFLFAIGFCTRVTGVLTWAGMLSYIQRGPSTLFGMDTIMNVVVIYLIIGSSGAALSVDRLIARNWWTRRSGRPASEFPPPAPLVSANLALRLLQVHVCIIYMASGLSKLLGPAWWDGTAVWGTMANPEFSPMRYALYMGFLRLLAEHRWLWHLVMTAGTFFTLFFEISFAFLVWNRRLRWIMVVAAVLLHLGIALFMGLVTFSMIMLTAVLAFVPAETVHQLFSQLVRLRNGTTVGTRDRVAVMAN
jgi:hypothetical protein